MKIDSRTVGIVLFLPWYLFCWQMSYFLINQDSDLSMSYEYFLLAWTFSGGMHPTYVWVISIATFFTSILIIKRLYLITNKSTENG